MIRSISQTKKVRIAAFVLSNYILLIHSRSILRFIGLTFFFMLLKGYPFRNIISKPLCIVNSGHHLHCKEYITVLAKVVFALLSRLYLQHQRCDIFVAKMRNEDIERRRCDTF